MNLAVPVFNLSNLFPNVDLSEIEELDIPIIGNDSALNGNTLRDFINGDVQLDLNDLMRSFDNSNISTISIPIEQLIDSIFNTSNLPTSIAHNFTVFEDFDQPKGKFGDTLGNVAIIDCKYMNRLFETTYNQYFTNLVET